MKIFTIFFSSLLMPGHVGKSSREQGAEARIDAARVESDPEATAGAGSGAVRST